MYNQEFREFIGKTVRCLEESGIDYVIVGGVALSLWGKPKKPHDIDIKLSLDTDQDTNDLLYDKLKSFGFKFVGKDRLNHPDYDFKYHIDITTEESNSTIDRRAFKRRQRVEFFGQLAYLVSPEDLIIARILWAATIPSPSDLCDAQSIVDRQGEKLDLDYLYSVAREEGVESVVGVLLAKSTVYWIIDSNKISYDSEKNSLQCENCNSSTCEHIDSLTDEQYLYNNPPIVEIPQIDLKTKYFVLASSLKREMDDNPSLEYREVIEVIHSEMIEMYFNDLELWGLESRGELKELETKRTECRVDVDYLEDQIIRIKHLKILIRIQRE
ncbi:MAG: nucleotidyltransferase domain-containing protein [Candidatus Odinarchaeota archaeon]